MQADMETGALGLGRAPPGPHPARVRLTRARAAWSLGSQLVCAHGSIREALGQISTGRGDPMSGDNSEPHCPPSYLIAPHFSQL